MKWEMLKDERIVPEVRSAKDELTAIASVCIRDNQIAPLYAIEKAEKVMRIASWVIRIAAEKLHYDCEQCKHFEDGNMSWYCNEHCHSQLYKKGYEPKEG